MEIRQGRDPQQQVAALITYRPLWVGGVFGSRLWHRQHKLRPAHCYSRAGNAHLLTLMSRSGRPSRFPFDVCHFHAFLLRGARGRHLYHTERFASNPFVVCVQPEFVTTRTVKSNAKVENDFGWGHPVCKRHPKLSLSKDLQIF